MVRHTSAESELLQVEQAASDNTTSKQMIFFIARSCKDRRPMVSDLYLTFQVENLAPLRSLYAAQRMSRKCVSAGSLP